MDGEAHHVTAAGGHWSDPGGDGAGDLTAVREETRRTAVRSRSSGSLWISANYR